MAQQRINLYVGDKQVTKEEILDIYQNLWKSPRGVIWFRETYGPRTLSYRIDTGIAYPCIGYNYNGQAVYTMADYNWAKALFEAEPPVLYDEETKRFLAELFPPQPYEHIDWKEFLSLLKENDPEFKQRSDKLSELVNGLMQNNASGRIDMDKVEIIPPSS
jgi:hypothetical protein